MNNEVQGPLGLRARAPLILAFVSSIYLGVPTLAAAQTVVVGTGNPDIDVPAVQAAVDQGGGVVLEGHFSFDRPPTIQPSLPNFPLAMVQVSKAVAITGTQVEHGEMTSIEGGTVPFEVEAPGASVTIQGLRFIRPKGAAIYVLAVNGLLIASCKIEGVEPVNNISNGISISTHFGPPTPDQPGHPEYVSGALLVVNNEIDVAGGTALDSTLGVTLFSVGVPGAEVEAYVSANTIRNTTERPINMYQIGGRAFVERNVITTSTILGPANFRGCRGTDVIHVTGTGAYLVAHNLVHSRWATGGGIRVHGQQSVWPIEHAIVVDNDVNMEAPEGTVFDECSAGIGVHGFASGNRVLGNRIRGRAGAALLTAVFLSGIPDNNSFVLNRFDDFKASLADVFVGDGVMNTLIVGQGTVEDHGIGTVVVPVAGRGGSKDKDKDKDDH